MLKTIPTGVETFAVLLGKGKEGYRKKKYNTECGHFPHPLLHKQKMSGCIRDKANLDSHYSMDKALGKVSFLEVFIFKKIVETSFHFIHLSI